MKRGFVLVGVSVGSSIKSSIAALETFAAERINAKQVMKIKGVPK